LYSRVFEFKKLCQFAGYLKLIILILFPLSPRRRTAGDRFIYEVLGSYSLHYPFIPKNYADIHTALVHILNCHLYYEC
jgi:hypothetical protein